MGRPKQTVDEKKLSSWKLLDDFRRRLARVTQTAAPKPGRRGGPERKLLEEDYFSLMLFGLFNPVVDSMRVQRKLHARHAIDKLRGLGRIAVTNRILPP